MLEESKMDKKSLNRSSQSQSRASAIDCKKNSELTHKPWPRQNKKREGSGTVPKNESYRKNVSVQRGSGQFDKRPRARGASNFVMGGMENSGIENDNEPEVGSVFVPGSKKQNLNHLLNFKYPERGGNDRKASLPYRQLQRRVLYRHEHDFYLRAYCQFVIKEGEDYMTMLDPNLPVKWEPIEEIVVRSTGRLECPICLGPPVAGRVGLCGHVYCWACVLHYEDAHEKQPPPCPVCTTPLQVKEMKPAKVLQWETSAEKITMRLVRRLRNSTVVEPAPPRGQETKFEAQPVLPLDCIHNAPYTRLFVANKQQVHDILYRERKELEHQIMAEIDTTEIVFLEQALEMLKLKEEKINTQYHHPKVIEESTNDTPTVYEKLDICAPKLDWFDLTDEGAASVEVIRDQIEDLNVTCDQSKLNPDALEFCQYGLNDDQSEEFPLIASSFPDQEEQINDKPFLTEMDLQNKKNYFYFYQAEDGQPVFLHSLNIRVLNASWGTLAAAPMTITGCVLHRETMLVNEQVKNLPYTAHLPNSCSYDIVELDLQPPDVTLSALQSFTEDLDRRARIRARNERDERRRERAYRRTMEGPPKPDFTSEEIFPSVPYSSPPALDPLPPPADQCSPSTSAASPSPGLSFAKMASTSGTWRTRKISAPTSPSAPKQEEDSSVPKFLLSDVFEAALQAAPTVTTSSGKKNKKSKQKVLFSTGIHRAI